MSCMNLTSGTKSAFSLSFLVLLLTGTVLYAGPLDPPIGPVASTHKTLSEVEPRIAVNLINTPGLGTNLYRITQPGSYYLTGNITGVNSRHGIEIASSGVTLDLMGFELLGVPGSLDGISVVGNNIFNVAVVNGSVRNWGGDGVDLSSASISLINSRVEKINATGNTGYGIQTTSSSTVSNCSAAFNIVAGIHTGNGSAVTNCSGTGNGTYGISTLGGCSVTNCAVYQNNGNGINVGVSCTVSDSSSFDNGGNGINAGNSCTVSGCSTSQNDASGINTGSGGAITNCSVQLSGMRGISGGSGSNIADCTSYNNIGIGIALLLGGSATNCTSQINSIGISGTGCAITNCKVANCSSYGIEINEGTIAGCNVSFSSLDGIRGNNACIIRDNEVFACGQGANDGAGIHVLNSHNRIEGNNCTDADRGIDVDGASNVIVRNTCSGNTINWTFVASNYYGPIIDRTGFASAAVNGSVGADTLGSTHPNANFTY